MNQIVKEIATDAAYQHITHQQIADRTGLDRKTVSAILSGETESPRCETVQAIARCLGGEIIYQTQDSKKAVNSGDVSYYRTLIAGIQHQLDVKDKWIRLLFITCLSLIGIIVITDMICFFCLVP